MPLLIPGLIAGRRCIFLSPTIRPFKLAFVGSIQVKMYLVRENNSGPLQLPCNVLKGQLNSLVFMCTFEIYRLHQSSILKFCSVSVGTPNCLMSYIQVEVDNSFRARPWISSKSSLDANDLYFAHCRPYRTTTKDFEAIWVLEEGPNRRFLFRCRAAAMWRRYRPSPRRRNISFCSNILRRWLWGMVWNRNENLCMDNMHWPTLLVSLKPWNNFMDFKLWNVTKTLKFLQP